MQRLLPLFFLLLATACGGATAKAPTEEPKVTMKSVGLSQVSFTGAKGQLAMDIFNPNSFGLPLTRVDWKLSVGDAHAVDGGFLVRETIPAKASAPVHSDFQIGASSAMLLTRVVSEGAKDYTLNAVLHFQSRLGDIRVEVRHVGQLAEVSEAADTVALR